MTSHPQPNLALCALILLGMVVWLLAIAGAVELVRHHTHWLF